MKNIFDICKDFGIEVPADKQADFQKSFNENYKTVVDYNKVVAKRDEYKEAKETAEETLKGFEGKDFDTITRERDEWKRKHDELTANHQREAEEREFNEILNTAISDAKGKNAKAITALLDLEKLKSSRNQEKDIKAALDSLRTDSGYLFEDNGGAAHFTAPNGNGGAGGTVTVKDIMSIKDPVERQAKIVQNMHLFKKG